MSQKTFLILFTSLIIITIHAANTGHRQQYGDVCNKSRKCDFTKWFRCKQMQCVCYNPPGKDELYYDESAKRCVGKAGTNCSQKFFPFDDEDEKIFHSRGTTTNHWRYGNGTLRCGANSFCEFNAQQGHFCKCKKNYFEAEDGTCAKLKGYGDSCKVDIECDPDSFLQCVEGTCKCEGELRIYDTDLNKCLVPAGNACETRKNKDDGRKVDDCPLNSVCNEDGYCQCELGTQIHSDRTCQRGYGMECGPDHPCGDSKLSCRSKVCQCKYPLHMEYDENVGQCLSLASGPCTYNDTSEFRLECTHNAECVNRNMITECRCKAGYVQTEQGTCTKVHGSTCEFDLECDPYPGLACINNNCSCPDMLQQFDPKARKCRGLVGSRCEIGGAKACVENANCKHYDQEEHGKIGTCLCDQRFKVSAQRTCEPV